MVVNSHGRYTLSVPEKPEGKCSELRCFNSKFSDFEQCAPHCSKSDYENDLGVGLIEAFYNALKKHIKQIRNPEPTPQQSELARKALGSSYELLQTLSTFKPPKIKFSDHLWWKAKT